jgi:hypothetical protein
MDFDAPCCRPTGRARFARRSATSTRSRKTLSLQPYRSLTQPSQEHCLRRNSPFGRAALDSCPSVETVVEVSKRNAPTGQRRVFKAYPKDDEFRTLRVRQGLLDALPRRINEMQPGRDDLHPLHTNQGTDRPSRNTFRTRYRLPSLEPAGIDFHVRVHDVVVVVRREHLRVPVLDSLNQAPMPPAGGSLLRGERRQGRWPATRNAACRQRLFSPSTLCRRPQRSTSQPRPRP